MTQVADPPPECELVAPPAALNFLDSQSVTLTRPVTALEAWDLIMAQPLPGLKLAFRVRDAISGLFGVARISGFSGRRQRDPQKGDKLDFFLVEDIAPDRLILTARDRHLDTMTCVNAIGGQVTVTSSVKTHNTFGRVYMWPVAPAHKLIVRVMLGRLARSQRAV